MSSSEDFFNRNLGQTAQLKSRRSRAAPPPPARPSAAAAPAASSSYYGGSSTTTAASTSRAAAPAPPRRPAAAGATQQQTSTTASASHSSAAPSFYGNTGGYSSNAAPAASTSYYGTPVPAPAPAVGSMTSSAAAPVAATTNSDWYRAPAPAVQAPAAPAAQTSNSNSDWYSAPQQQQQQQQSFQPQQPAYTDFSSAPQQTKQPASLAGTMDGSSSSQAPFYGGSTFTPSSQPATMQSSSNIYENFENEPPLLEELGINMEHIFLKTKAVVLPFSQFGVDQQQVMHEENNDLAGPLVFALLLGGELMLTGKLQFSYIYGFGLFGCLSMTLVLNLMSPVAVSIWAVASILGYALLPVNVLAVVKIFVVNLGKLEKLGALLAILTIAWCTVASTRLLEQKCGMRDQRYLVAYPIALLYSAFVMLAVF